MTANSKTTNAINTDALQFQPGTKVRTVNSLTEIVSADLPQEVRDLITSSGMDIYQRNESPMFLNRKPNNTGKILTNAFNKQAWLVEHDDGLLAIYLCRELEVVS